VNAPPTPPPTTAPAGGAGAPLCGGHGRAMENAPLKRAAAAGAPAFPGADAAAPAALPAAWHAYAAKRRAGHKRSRLSACSRGGPL
jgi:hypothetical protein